MAKKKINKRIREIQEMSQLDIINSIRKPPVPVSRKHKTTKGQLHRKRKHKGKDDV
jgi:hypothetical protein